MLANRNFFDWARREHFLFRQSLNGSFYSEQGVPRPSHNDLFGSMLQIKDQYPELRASLFQKLNEALDDEEPIGLCENRTMVTAFYLDLDFEGPEEESTESIVSLMHALLEQLVDQGLFTVPPTWILAKSPVLHKGDVVKTGAHVIFHKLLLKYETMIRFNYVLTELANHVRGARSPPYNTWEDVFDKSMYRTGLRMLFMDKPVPCPTCTSKAEPNERPSMDAMVRDAMESSSSISEARKLMRNVRTMGKATWETSRLEKLSVAELESASKASREEQTSAKSKHETDFPCAKRQRLAMYDTGRRAQERARDRERCARFNSKCGQCRNGYIPQGRPYTIVAVSNPELNTREFIDSLATNRPRAWRMASIRRPDRRVEDPADLHDRLAPVPEPPIDSIPRGMKKKQCVFISLTDARARILRQLISAYDVRYRRLDVGQATVSPDYKYLTVHVSGYGSNQCANRKSPGHSRAKVYFIVSRSHIWARCTSRSDTTSTRYRGKCSLYRGPHRPIGKEQADALFTGLSCQRPATICLSARGHTVEVDGAEPNTQMVTDSSPPSASAPRAIPLK